MERKKIEIIEKVDSVKFYRSIYNKACNSFWELRAIFLLLAGVGCILVIFSFDFGIIFISSLLWKNIKPLDGKIIFLLFAVGFILLLPTILVLFRIKKGRSNKYLYYLKQLKFERNLDNKAINDLLEDISNLRIKYKDERDNLFRIALRISKLAVLPITAVMFTSVSKYFYYDLLLLVLICGSIFPLLLSFWIDNRILESIKNYYVISVAERELKFLKTLQSNYL